jgi:hypothetical protein
LVGFLPRPLAWADIGSPLRDWPGDFVAEKISIFLGF